jgi:hypothetical protein
MQQTLNSKRITPVKLSFRHSRMLNFQSKAVQMVPALSRICRNSSLSGLNSHVGLQANSNEVKPFDIQIDVGVVEASSLVLE